jgi:Ca2+-binding RTX toxin-like protein
MKRTCLSFLCALLAVSVGAGSVRAAETVFKTSLVTSDAATRVSVELAEDGETTVALSDGEGAIESGEVEIDKDGKVKLELEGVSIEEGSGFLLINQGDADGDLDRDFVFSAPFTISEGEGGKVDVEFEGAIPLGTKVEDVLITVLLDSGGEGEPVLDGGDTILAVPGFTTEEEVEEEEFEVEGTVSGLDGECSDVTFTITEETLEETLVTADENTEYKDEKGCTDLVDGAQVKVKGVVVDDINLATEVEFLEEGPEGGEIFCVEGEKCEGTDGDDTIIGTDVDDEIEGGNGNDVIFGMGGNDEIEGGNGNDTIDGGEDNDTLEGGNGTDTLNGGLGDDEFDGGNGPDTITCGDGFDEGEGGRGPDEIADDCEDVED